MPFKINLWLYTVKDKGVEIMLKESNTYIHNNAKSYRIKKMINSKHFRFQSEFVDFGLSVHLDKGAFKNYVDQI